MIRRLFLNSSLRFRFRFPVPALDRGELIFAAEMKGGAAVFLLKQTIEIRKIVKSRFPGDCRNGIRRGQEHPGRHSQPVIIQIRSKRNSHIAAEEFHKVGFAEPADSGSFRNGDFLTVTGFHIFQNFFQPIQGFVVS